jgi:hypothetical protein
VVNHLRGPKDAVTQALCPDRIGGGANDFVLGRLERLKPEAERAAFFLSPSPDHSRERFQTQADRSDEIGTVVPQSAVHPDQSTTVGADSSEHLPYQFLDDRTGELAMPCALTPCHSPPALDRANNLRSNWWRAFAGTLARAHWSRAPAVGAPGAVFSLGRTRSGSPVGHSPAGFVWVVAGGVGSFPEPFPGSFL